MSGVKDQTILGGLYSLSGANLYRAPLNPLRPMPGFKDQTLLGDIV
jgi:hypothetical protein